MDCVCVPFRGWMGKTKYLSAIERGMIVGARRTDLSVSRTVALLGILRSIVFGVYQEWSTTQRTSNHLETTVGIIGVTMGHHPCGMLSTPCSDKLRMFWGHVPNVLYTQCIHVMIDLGESRTATQCCKATLYWYWHVNTSYFFILLILKVKATTTFNQQCFTEKWNKRKSYDLVWAVKVIMLSGFARRGQMRIFIDIGNKMSGKYWDVQGV